MRTITLMAAVTGAAAALAAAPVTAAEAVAGRGTDPEWQNLTSFRVSPVEPHQNDVIRVLVHCPDEANHAIVGSTAFPIKGSWRLFREVGLGLSEKGFAKKGVIISRYAPPGQHVIRMKCVKVIADKPTGLRKVEVVSRSAAPLVVRPFRVGQFF